MGMNLPAIVVRLQDLLTPSGNKFNTTFSQIKTVGDIHNHQNFKGQIILSTIMRDDLIAKVPLNMYVEAIQVLRPDSCLTPDAETYESTTYWKDGQMYYDGKEVSSKEVIRVSSATMLLRRIFPNQHFIGLVKGSSAEMIENHAKFLVSQGITDLALHIGDFMRFGINDNIQRGKLYATIIRRIGKQLFLFGMGCQARLLEFSFADAYITYSHFIAARHGLKFAGTKAVSLDQGYSPELVRNNLQELLKNIKRIQFQRKLFEDEKEWDKAYVMEELLTHPMQGMATTIPQ